MRRMTQAQRVSAQQLATELGLHPTYAREIACKISAKLGITPERRQFPGSRQRQFSWTRAEADRIIEAREADGFLVNRTPA